MEKINLSVVINAPKEKVWNSLWEIFHYNTWTSAFAEGSTVQTDNWKEGSKVVFHDGSGQGMLSSVAVNRPNEFMSFRHLGMVNNGVEDTTSDAVKPWVGAMENYTLQEKDGQTTLTIESDISAEYKEMFEKMWPAALEKVKGLAEGTIKPVITVSAEVNAPVAQVWDAWTTPKDIMQWNQASEDWHCPAASNDLKTGGKFSSTMAAKDGSFSFDFAGDYNEVKDKEFIHATMGDGRMWKTYFKTDGDKTVVTEKFEAETMNSIELQQGGWQAILDNFKKYTENKSHQN
jgi:uncharacterized protein YndB with AHSA1/START domain